MSGYGGGEVCTGFNCIITSFIIFFILFPHPMSHLVYTVPASSSRSFCSCTFSATKSPRSSVLPFSSSSSSCSFSSPASKMPRARGASKWSRRGRRPSSRCCLDLVLQLFYDELFVNNVFVVAIGGITQALPFLYRSFFAELHEYPANHRKKSLIFIGSIVLGLSICALFNIYWCFVIVNVVPQRNDQCSGELYSLMMMISSVTFRAKTTALHVWRTIHCSIH